MKVGIELRKKSKTPDVGRLHIRISVNSKNSYKSLGKDLKFKYWDKEKQRVKSTYKGAKDLNHFLDNELLKYNHSGLTGLNNSRISALDYFNKIASEQIYSTQKSYTYIIKKFDNFLDSKKLKNILLQDLDDSIMKDFVKWLEVENDINANSRRSIFVIIKSFINKAIDDNIVNYYRHPCKGIVIKTIPTKKVYLNQEELFKLVAFKGDKYLNLTKNIFIFQTSVQGIRVGDALLLKFRDIEFQNGYLNISLITLKSKKRINARLNRLSLSVIDEYIWNDNTDQTIIDLNKEIKKQESVVDRYLEAIEYIKQGNFVETSTNGFPSRKQITLKSLINKGLFKLKVEIEEKKDDLDKLTHKLYAYRLTNTDKDKPIFFFNNKFDNYKKGEDLTMEEVNAKSSILTMLEERLSRICLQLGIKKVTTHSARHTFAMLAKMNGFTMDQISDSLTHYSVLTTKSYMHELENNQEINNKTSKMFNDF